MCRINVQYIDAIKKTKAGQGDRGDVGAVLDGTVQEDCSEEVACEQRP